MLRRARLLAGAVGAVGLALHGDLLAAHPAAFSIEQVMAAPFPSSLLAASAGKAVAWVFDDRGCRNVWVADAAHGMKGRAVTTFTADEGFDIGELVWSPDARLLAFTRGGSLEDDRPANTESSAAGPVPREVWLVPSAGGAARMLHAGHSAAFSPDGSRVAFADGARVWAYATEGGSAAQTLLVDEGQVASLRFSPDGRKLAFVSRRTRHSLIGVYDFATQRIAWMSPSLDQDSSATFSPSGSELAFIRVPSEDVPIFVTRRSGQPWSIWVADAQTGAGRRVWVADPGAGSVFQSTQSEQNLLWMPHDRLVFPWEKTGWLQLYAVAAGGGTALAITSGAFEIAHLALSADRTRVVYSSNQDDPERLHVWSVDPGRGRPVRAGSDSAIEDAPQMSADGTLYALRSDAIRPLEPMMLVGGRWQALAPGSVPEFFPQAQLVRPESVSFPASDAQTAYGQIFRPRAAAAGRHAAILFFHGGPERQMLLGFHPMDAYSFMYALDQYFVSEGYIVLSVNYRGGSGYGLDFREAPGAEAGGGAELNDLLGAVAYLKGREDVDPRRIGIWGGSYGGLMTALGLARASKDLAAGVDYAGLYSWVTFLKAVGFPIASPAAAHLALESSPAATIEAWKSPVLVVQADDDRDVPLSQSAELIEALRARHIDHEEMILPNEIHNLARYADWIRFFHAADGFFERYLQAPEAGARRQ
jgi:dipeptidyl aminopeptidase/acylaminoacyl peptidase